MKINAWLTAALLPLVLGCGAENADMDDAPLDDEYGVIDYSRADSNAVVRPGTPEAEAVLRFVNQPLRDAAEAARFEALLDTKLHHVAATSIVEARAGRDGIQGTADDPRFETLRELDEIRYVGRVALLRMFELAEAGGYFRQSIECELDWIHSLQDLVEIENSGCDHFSGDVTLVLEDTMLPAYRTLKSLDGVRRIEGKLTILYREALDVAVFGGLEYLGELDTENLLDGNTGFPCPAEFPALREVGKLTVREDPVYRFEFPALEKAGSLVAENGYDYPSLREAGSIFVETDRMSGFHALEQVGSLTVRTHQVDGFERLRTAESLLVESTMQWGMIMINGFGDLETVGELRLLSPRSGGEVVGGFPKLQSAETIQLEVFADFPALEVVGALSYSGGNVPFRGRFDALVQADYIDVSAIRYPFPALVRVEKDFKTRANEGPEPSALEYVGHDFDANDLASEFTNLVEVGSEVSFFCENGEIRDVFGALTSAGGFDLHVSCKLSGLSGVRTTGQMKISILEGGTFDALENLTRSGALEYNHHGEQQVDILPQLERVGGDLDLYATKPYGAISLRPAAVRGLNALDGIDGSLWIHEANEVDGLANLRSVGGRTIGIDADMPVAERDRFLGQIEQFSGVIEDL